MNAAHLSFRSKLGYPNMVRTLASACLALLAAAGLAGPAAAATSERLVLLPGTQVRLISSDRLRSDGTTLVGLEIEMPEGRSSGRRKKARMDA